MRDHEITVENRQIRPRGLAERGVCDATYELEQRAFCRAAGFSFSPPTATQMITVSPGVFEREMPLEGIRYPAPPHMSGWYFTTPRYDGNFASMRVEHAYHLTALRPDLAKLLALPAGSWFVLHEDHEDVGFDAAVASEDRSIAQHHNLRGVLPREPHLPRRFSAQLRALCA